MLRTFTLIIVGLVTAFWLWMVAIAVLTNWGPEENGFAMAIAMVASVPFLVLALPALLLAFKRKFVGLALALALFSLVSIALVA